jgi:hypothetical protein
MRSKILIRCGIASLLIGGGAGGLFAAGCGSDDNGAPPNNADSGPDGNQVGDDATGGDDGGITVHPDSGNGGRDADAAPPPVHGKLILVHASSYAPPLRFCFGLSPSTAAVDAGPSSIAKTFPAPNNVLGLPPGTGGAAADNSSDLATENITIFGINAGKLTALVADAGGELNCSQLIGNAALAADAGGLALTPGIDYWNLGTLPAGTLADATTTLVAVTGCAPGNGNASAAEILCPMGYDPTVGDLGLSYTKLDTTTVTADASIGAQVAYASYPFSQYAKLSGGTGAAAAGFFINSLVLADAGAPADAGDAATDAGDAAVDSGTPTLVPVRTFVPVAAPVTFGELFPTTLVQVPGVTFDGTSGFVFTAFGADGGPNTPSVGVPLPGIQAISYPNLPTTEFQNGSGYVFILVGNPLEPTFVGPDGGGVGAGDAGTFNPLSAHILGFPVNPAFGTP